MSELVYIVDDDAPFLEATARCLRFAGLQVAPFPTPCSFLDAYRSSDAQADCLVTDVRMPQMSGLELGARLREEGCRLPVVFVTGHGDVPMAVSALKQGAVDFLEKPFRAQTLVDTVRRALALERRRREQDGERARLESRYARLSGREREVLDALVANEPAKRIASRLGISPRTVEHHRENLMAKMHAGSWRDLVLIALALERPLPLPRETGSEPGDTPFGT